MTHAKPQPHLRVAGVTKAFERPVLRGVDLELRPGECFGLVGPAASGKSLLLKLICGLVRPDAGRLVLAGQDLSALSEQALFAVRASIGMLFQNNALFDFMDVLQNVAFPLIRAGVPRPEAEERAARRLREVGLGGSQHKQPSELSGGMKKRVGIARASVGRPELVILDEPTAGLDPVTTSKIYDLIAKDREQTGATFLIVSSDLEALSHFASRMGLLHQGRLLYDGPPRLMAESEDPVVRQFARGDLEGPL